MHQTLRCIEKEEVRKSPVRVDIVTHDARRYQLKMVSCREILRGLRVEQWALKRNDGASLNTQNLMKSEYKQDPRSTLDLDILDDPIKSFIEVHWNGPSPAKSNQSHRHENLMESLESTKKQTSLHTTQRGVEQENLITIFHFGLENTLRTFEEWNWGKKKRWMCAAGSLFSNEYLLSRV